MVGFNHSGILLFLIIELLFSSSERKVYKIVEKDLFLFVSLFMFHSLKLINTRLKRTINLTELR